MKRILILLCALCLAAVPVSAEDSEKPVPAGVYTPSPWGELWAAPAVPLGDGLLLTSWAALPEDRSGLTVSAGGERKAVKAAVPDRDGVLALLAYEPEGKEENEVPYTIMPRGKTVRSSDCLVETGDGRTVRVMDASPFQWRGYQTYLLTLEDQAPLGSLLLTRDGELAGIAVAKYAEGPNRMVFLSSEQIAGSLVSFSEKLRALDGLGEAPEGLTVTLEKNAVILDWNEAELPEAKDGENVYLILADAGNDYLNYCPADKGLTTYSYLLEPGRVYIAGFGAFDQAPDALPEKFALVIPGPAEDLTEFGFEPVTTSVAVLPEGAPEGTEPVPADEVTEDIMRSGRAYFYSSSRYALEEEEMSRTLLVTLTDPNGVSYRYESLWVYQRPVMEDDTWYVSLKEAGLTDFLDANGYPPGVYELAFYVGGCLADNAYFELK